MGADTSNANQMIHLLASTGQLTIVVDNLQDIASASMVRGLRERLLSLPAVSVGQAS